MKKYATKTRLLGILAMILAIAILCPFVAQLTAPAHALYENPSFTDVPKNNYAYTSVEEAVANKWITGYPGGQFGPNDNVNYAQMNVMLVRAFFKDEYDALYEEASRTVSGLTWYGMSCTSLIKSDC